MNVLNFEKTAWNSVTVATLIDYPEESLGFQLGSFLMRNDLETEPDFETFDVFHVLTNFGLTVTEEIALQYYLLGNGKKSIYGLLYVFAGTLMLLHKVGNFWSAFRKGRQAHRFYDLDFSKMLQLPVNEIRFTFNIR